MPAASTDNTVVEDFVCAGAVATFVFVILFTPIIRHTRRIGFILQGWSPGLRIERALLPSQFPSGTIDKTLTAYSRGGGCGWDPPVRIGSFRIPI